MLPGKCFWNIYLLANKAWLLLFFHTTVLHCVFLHLFHIQNFHCCQLEFCRCCHCRVEFCIAGKKSSLRKGSFTLNVWYTAAYLQSRKKLLQHQGLSDLWLYHTWGDWRLSPAYFSSMTWMMTQMMKTNIHLHSINPKDYVIDQILLALFRRMALDLLWKFLGARGTNLILVSRMTCIYCDKSISNF